MRFPGAPPIAAAAAFVAFAAFAALSAGCLAGPGDGPNDGVVHPRGFPEPWGPEDGWAGVRASRSDGCGGPCAGDWSQGPENAWTGVDADGRVLQATYSLGAEPGVRFMDPGLEPWRPVLEPVFAGGGEHGQVDGHGVRVFAVYAKPLSSRDAARVDAALDAIEPRLEPLGPPVYDCSDCSADVLHGAGLRVELWGNAPEGSAWSRLDRQVEALGSWVRADA